MREEGHSRGTMDLRILRTLATIDCGCAQRLRVSRLAAQIGLIRSRFEHLFKEQTGQTFSRRLREIRLNKAKSLLGELSLSIKEVMCRCGYSSAPTFSRDFKSLFQITPSEYRRNTFG